jgi:hypothetical protein
MLLALMMTSNHPPTDNFKVIYSNFQVNIAVLNHSPFLAHILQHSQEDLKNPVSCNRL